MTIHFFERTLLDWQRPNCLAELDQTFLHTLKQTNPILFDDLLKYREGKFDHHPLQISEIIIAAGRILDSFLIDFFEIEKEAQTLQLNVLKNQPVFAFKKWFVQRRAKRRLTREEALPNFDELTSWLMKQIQIINGDKELAIGVYSLSLLEQEEACADAIEKLTQWCIQAINTAEGQAYVKGWSSFKLPEKRDYQRLIPIIPIKNVSHSYLGLPPNNWRTRDGFKLTDNRMNEREVLSEIDYCIYCHDHDGDFCSKGFPEKKGDPSQGFRKNPLDNLLTGCPLDEKISEMHTLKRDAFNLGALAMIMIDNPMCPATGHRICNDCMKGCIYQKQDPVNIPQVETRILTDVLTLPWGIEIYDLLTRWNPLRKTQWLVKPYNGLKAFIAGMGPAGFTMAHHLLMEGFAVVGTDGLKIEPLPDELLSRPIQHFDDIKEALDERLMLGFGGVAEYGITVRWDKNFLKLIYLSLARRPYLQIFGGVRFGGTVTVEDLWELGFDHTVIAVGAGLPKALPIPHSMAKGMRQANDFLMALQLTGAGKMNSLANLQIRMPIIVIGGGLTGVDAATEAQAYYITQVEKTLYRYERLCQEKNEALVRSQFDKESLIILDEFIAHGKRVREERVRARAENRAPNFLPLLHELGGATIVYRKTMQASPAYISNHEELAKALEEGIFYLENLQPVSAVLDESQWCKALMCETTTLDAEGNLTKQPVRLEAKTILVATGAQPNIAYTFEHPHTFKRNGLQYQNYEDVDGSLETPPLAENIKDPDFGPFTSYSDHDDHRVSFVGDTHPVFHGNVVKAIASSLRTYPKIVALFGERANQLTSEDNYVFFSDSMTHYFSSRVLNVTRRAPGVVELEIHAPMAAKRFQPGQFFRLQNFETQSYQNAEVSFQMEPLALSAFSVNKEKGSLKVMVLEQGTSSKICSMLKINEPVSFMGPTGVRSKLPEDRQHILIVGGQLSLAYVRALGKELREKGNRVTFIGAFKQAQELFCQTEIENCTDQIIWATEDGSMISTHREHDQFIQGNLIDAILYCKTQSLLSLFDRITFITHPTHLQSFQHLRLNVLQNAFKPDIRIFASVYSTMQCMLKGVCAQCLQWQIDPETGKRSKAVFACSWQDQPIDLIELENLSDRLGQNRASECLSNLWLEHIQRRYT